MAPVRTVVLPNRLSRVGSQVNSSEEMQRLSEGDDGGSGTCVCSQQVITCSITALPGVKRRRNNVKLWSSWKLKLNFESNRWMKKVLKYIHACNGIQ